MSRHIRTSSTVVTSPADIQPRFEVVFQNKNEMNNEDEYPEHDFNDDRSSNSPKHGRVTSEHYAGSETTYNASTGFYSSTSETVTHEHQQQNYSQHYVIPPEPREYLEPEQQNYSQHYVIPPEPREYTGPDIVQTDDWEPQILEPAAQQFRQSGARPKVKAPVPPTAIGQNGAGSEATKPAPAAENTWANVNLAATGATSQADAGFDGSLKEKGIQEVILGKDDKGKLGLKTKSIKKGIYVMEVVKGSPSAKAGVSPGDRILQINGVKVDLFDEEKMHNIFKKMPNKGIRLLINRRPLEKVITLQKDNNGRLGITLRSTKIHTVVKGSPADIVGLSTDYYIIEINGKNVRGMRDSDIRKLMESGTSITITVMPYFLYEPLMKQIPIR